MLGARNVLVERFHRISHGALGLNAASEVGYSFVTDVYLWGFVDGLWLEFMPDYPVYGSRMIGYDDLRPCTAMTSGKFFLAQSSWPYNPQQKTYVYHLFHHHGDAFTTLYSEMPQYLTAVHDSVLPAGQTYFGVSADNSSVIALTINGEIVGVAEGTGAPVVINIPPQSAGDTMIVTVTKANYFRYESNVPVAEVGVAEIERNHIVPEMLTISSIAPNPFKENVAICYGLPMTARTTVTIYDAVGKSVATLCYGKQQPGRHVVNWKGGDASENRCPAGVYFFVLQVEERQTTRKIVLPE